MVTLLEIIISHYYPMKHLSAKIQEVTWQFLRKMKSNVRQIIQPGIPGPKGTFSDKVTTGIDGFTDESVVQCDVIFLDDSK